VRVAHELKQMRSALQRLDADAAVTGAWEMALESDDEDESVNVILERSRTYSQRRQKLSTSAASESRSHGIATIKVTGVSGA
jgi:hypothetical protein